MSGNLLNKFFDIPWLKRVLFTLRIIPYENIKKKFIGCVRDGLNINIIV